MIRTTINEILNIISGNIVFGSGELSFSKVYQDSRLVSKEGIFFAISGELFDGHNFVESAIEKGARAIVVEENKVEAKLLEKIENSYEGVCVIEVDNTVKALQTLAKSYMKKIDPVVVGITGSTGKTTTRDLIYSICNRKFKTHKNQGNFNSNVGVPLTVLDMDEDTKVAVIEMGTDHKGEIFEIADIVRPNIAVITNIGISHMENFQSQKEIFLEKMDITAFMKEGDCLVALDDDNFFPNQMKDYSSEHRSELILTALIGDKNRDYFIIKDIEDSVAGTDVAMVFRDDGKQSQERFSVSLKGKHNGENAALAIAVCEMLGIDRDTIREGLANAEITGKRLEVTEKNGVIIIDDTYNASPDSMRAAIDVLYQYRDRRRIAILGDMYQLGDNEEMYHREIGEYARKKVDKLITVGKLGRTIDLENNFESKEEMASSLKEYIQNGDAILFKASRGMKLDETVKDIKEWLGE